MTKTKAKTDEVLSTVAASGPRRWFGVATMGGLGAILIYIAFTTTPAFGWQVFLVVMGVGAVVLADATRRATENVIELTETELRVSNGEVIATLDEIDVVRRAMFDMKPSNGFALKLKQPRLRRWQPGLWWALGRRVGVGGVTPGSQGKAMAQTLEALLAERKAGRE
ncbi:hypothetical protein BXY66_2005 [Shimia isoporae]|uniref:PH (Pleckstrin Homology) domain-containing protein n=1 Tax=Shimia isoporae TaxID=647720 RepID=A0A4R1NXE5_9RHOB|nr:hypothetical protein [Shimia isoporae]TCL09938.1 hypothetical protein BXY66_2005 [Shimia isoporae]